MWCPCPTPWEEEIYIEDESLLSYEDYTNFHRRLQEAGSESTTTNTEEEAPVGSTWEMIYVGVVLVIMFGVLLSDRVGVSVVNYTDIYLHINFLLILSSFCHMSYIGRFSNAYRPNSMHVCKYYYN